MDYAHEMVIPSEHLPFKIFQFEGKDGNYRETDTGTGLWRFLPY